MSDNSAAPPIYQPIVDQGGKATLPWILFFNNIFAGDPGKEWNPTFQSLTVVGSQTIKGRVYALSSSISFFSLTITPLGGGSSSSTAGTTYIDNFPLTMNANGVCFAVSGLLGGNPGMCDQQSNRIYPPSWTTVTVPLTVLGLVEAS